MKVVSPSESYSESNEISQELLHEIYSKSLPCADIQDKDGVFYTPLDITRQMVELALGPKLKNLDLNDILKIKILDPACGSGIFLIVVYKFLLSEISTLFFESKPVSADLRGEVLQNCIFGFDKDPRQVIATQDFLKRIAQVDLNSNLLNISVRNTLLEPCPANVRFDVVIGNPPYGLSRDEKLSPAENQELKQIFANYRFGKPNKYLLFMARGLEVLTPNGVMSYIVPNAWLGIKTADYFRKILLEKQILSNIINFDYPVFPDLGVETVIFKVDLQGDFDAIQVTKQSRDGSQKHAKVKVNSIINTPGTKIPVLWNQQIETVLGFLDSSCIPLVQNFKPAIAMQAYSSGKGTPKQSKADVKNRIFDRKSKDHDNSIPYLEGKDIKRYQLDWSGGYLLYGPWLAEPQKLERFEGPRVILREILGKRPYFFIAVFTDQTFLYNKSCLHILPRDLANASALKALALILNSQLASFIILHRGIKSQRKLFPKILNADLTNFPLPKDLDIYINILAGIYDDLAIDPANTDLQANADSAVFNAYKMPPEYVSMIKEALC